MQREVPSLFTTVVRFIAKNPSHVALNDDTFARASAIGVPIRTKPPLDLPQFLIDEITDAGRLTDDVIPIKVLKDRSYLSLKNTKLTNKSMIQMIDVCCDTLVRLDLQGTFFVDDALVKHIMKKCKALDTLSLRNCRKLTDSTLERIAEHGNNLHRLDLGGNFNYTTLGIQNFLKTYQNLSNLVELNISGLFVDSDTLLLLTKCTSLTKLSIGYADTNEQSLRLLLNAIGYQLDNLNISWIEQISAAFFSEYLAKAAPRLVELDICGLGFVTQTCILEYLEMNAQQVELMPQDFCKLQRLRAKFLPFSSTLLEQSISFSFPHVTLLTTNR